MPELVLQGKYIEELGFTTGVLVSAVYQDACLTLSTLAATNTSSVICVTSRLMRGKERTQLILDGFLLKRYGFNAGDRVVLHLMPNTIQITKINFYATARCS